MYVGGEWTTKQAKKSKTVVMEAMPTRELLKHSGSRFKWSDKCKT